MSFTSVTVTGTYLGPDNVTPATGAVEFRLSHAMHDGSGNTIRTGQLKRAVLDGSGQISVVLAATDDSTTLPIGVTYQVTEKIDGAPARSYDIEVPNSPTSLNLADIAPLAAGLNGVPVLIPGPPGPTGATGAAGATGPAGPAGEDGVSGAAVDADATTKGVVQLAGDLSGTADAPTVPGLALKANAASPAFTGAATFSGTADIAGHLAVGADGALDPLVFGQPTKYVLHASETITGNTINSGVQARLTLNPSAVVTRGSTAVRGELAIPSGNAQNFNAGITGMAFEVDAAGSGHAAGIYGAAGTVYLGGPRSAGNLYGVYSTVDIWGSGDVDKVYGVAAVFQSDSTNHVTGDVYLYAAIHRMYGAGITNRIYAFWEKAPDLSGTVNEKYGVWLPDYAGISPLSYYSWFDSRGVLRVREDNDVDPGFPQAVQALYNPRFAKYTAGAVNHERIILGQWRDDVAEIGTENGGTGEALPLALIVGGTQKVLVDDAGDLEVLGVDQGIILKSASGTRYRITVADDGRLETEAV